MPESTRVLLIPIGIAGSGKTTHMDKIIKKLKKENKTVEKVSADDYEGLYSEFGEINKSKIKEAHNMCLRKVFEFMENRIENIILDNTNLKSNDWYDYLFIACNNDYRVYFMLPKYGLTYYNTGFTTIEKQLEFIKKIRSTVLDFNKPKTVPAPTIEKMYRDFILVKKLIEKNKEEYQCDPNLWIKLSE